MRHFEHLSPDDRERLFHLPPQDFARDDAREVLAMALGATLYSPATRPALATELVRSAARGVVSAVICLEDAVADVDLRAAEANAVQQLRRLAASGDPAPLVFVRVRTAEQVEFLVDALGPDLGVLSGFVVPKFTAGCGEEFLDVVADASSGSSGTAAPLYVMPVLESPEVVHAESRTAALADVAALLGEHRERVLAVRLGATDMSGLYGLRRSRGLTAYDVRLLGQVIADVVNVLGRCDGTGFTITGPVWEHFGNAERMFRPELRATPFVEHEERELRAHLLAEDLDGLIKEVALDKANGLTGKTVIHPSHVSAVHALSVVTHEEHSDASDVLSAEMATGGVRASGYGNKMNEAKPHRAWAELVQRRAAVFGVSRAEASFVDLLGASAT